MTTTSNAYTPEALDHDVKRLQELKNIRDDIEAEQSQILDRIRALELGQHTTLSGASFTISPPNRRFNIEKAVQLLPDETLAQCRAEGFDPAKVKRFLSPELLDMCMDEGRGEPRVSFR